jgi:multidrug efflux pump subunit AcrB
MSRQRVGRLRLSVLTTLAGLIAGVLLAAWLLRPPAGRRVEGASAEPAGRKQGPVVEVTTFASGLPASATEKAITQHIERRVSQAGVIDRVESHTTAGVSVVRVYFPEAADAGLALARVSALVQASLSSLPPEATPPLVVPLAPERRPLALLLVSSPELNEARLKDLARIDVRNLLAGRGSVRPAPVVLGGKDRVLAIYLDPRKLAARDLLPSQVIEALRKDSQPLPAGRAYFGANQVAVIADPGNVRQIGSTPLRLGDKAVFLRDVGQVEDASAVQTSLVRLNGRRCVAVPLYHYGDFPPHLILRNLGQNLSDMGKRSLPRGVSLTLVPLNTQLLAIHLRAPSNFRLAETEKRVADVERFLQANIPAEEREAIVSEVGVGEGPEALYTRNVGQQDATIYVRLSNRTTAKTQELAARLRKLFEKEEKFADLRAVFNAGDTPPPVHVRLEGGQGETLMEMARKVRNRVAGIQGTADVHIVQRLDAPVLTVQVDREKSAAIGLSARDVFLQALLAMNSPPVLHRHPWIDFRTGNQYTLEVQYPESPDRTLEDVINIPVTGTGQAGPVKLSSLVTFRRATEPVEIDHVNLSRVFDVCANVEGRDVQAVLDDVKKALEQMQVPGGMRIELQPAVVR